MDRQHPGDMAILQHAMNKNMWDRITALEKQISDVAKQLNDLENYLTDKEEASNG